MGLHDIPPERGTTRRAVCSGQAQIEVTDRAIDRLVDRLVYELYGLTEEEIKIVEGV